VSTSLVDAMPGDAGALAAGIVTGDDSSLSLEATSDFLATGTTHITAVSGSNVAMVLAVWSVVLPIGRQRRRMLIQLAIVGTILAYAVLVGMEPPVSRASIVAVGALLASRVGRVPDVMTLLGLSAAVLALVNPLNVHLASYWLSIVASVAIAIRMPLPGSSGGKQAFRSLLEGVVIAQVATVPLVLAWFGTWSPTSVVANVLLAPLMWAAFPLCFLLAMVTVAAPPLTPLVTLPPELLLEVSLRVVHVLARALPPVTVGETGPAAYLAVALPCVVIVLLMAGDSHRWWPVIADRRRDQPVVTLLAVVAPLIGILIGALVTVTLW
jgi:competence protein ComEC